MKRRSALKNMGMAFGYAVATPTVLSVLQSCKEKAAYAEWVPGFFGQEEGQALAMISDIILPKTDTPSATEMNVHLFIDEFVAKVLPEEQRDLVKMGMDKFFAEAMGSTGKDALSELNAEDYTPLLQKYLAKRTDEVEEGHNKAIGEYMMAKEQGDAAELDDEIAIFSFANGLRDLTTMAYKNAEFIGEEVLAYAPIPGEYIPCGNLNELTGGKAWSL